MYVHHIIAEQILGRALLPDEHVHHKDCNKHNNQPENLMVFASNADHIRFHSYHLDESSLVINENGAYVCVPREYKCVDCGTQISMWGTRCTMCKSIAQRKVQRPSQEELYAVLVQQKGNFTKISQQYSVTDNAVRKWCKRYGIPHKTSDYRK